MSEKKKTKDSNEHNKKKDEVHIKKPTPMDFPHDIGFAVKHVSKKKNW